MFFNVTLGTKRADCARAILGGITAEIRENLDIMSENVGAIKQIYVTGVHHCPDPRHSCRR
jgi:sugar (pentulose or hexulose) kinase